MCRLSTCGKNFRLPGIKIKMSSPDGPRNQNCSNPQWPNCSGMLRSASAARTQCSGVDRVQPGPGKLTLTDWERPGTEGSVHCTDAHLTAQSLAFKDKFARRRILPQAAKQYRLLRKPGVRCRRHDNFRGAGCRVSTQTGTQPTSDRASASGFNSI